MAGIRDFANQLLKFVRVPILTQLLADPPYPYGDGLTDQEAADQAAVVSPDLTNIKTGIIKDLTALGVQAPADLKPLIQLAIGATLGQPLDDRKLQVTLLLMRFQAGSGINN